MRVTFIQTSDPIVDYPMLQETSRTVCRYCLMNGFPYEQYVGIKQGHIAWQATFNRIAMLNEMLDRNVEGWVFYLDADAFIQEMRFDLVHYLSDKARYGAIFTGDLSTIHHVNAGGFAVNLSHPAGRRLVREYAAAFEATRGPAFDRAVLPEHVACNARYLLSLLLQRWFEQPGQGGDVLIEHPDRSYGTTGRFIGQLPRYAYPTVAERLEAVRALIAATLAGGPVPHRDRGAGLYIPARHPRLTSDCGRKTDAGLFSTGTAGLFLRGPQARLEAGAYHLRLFGVAETAVPASMVTSNDGQTLVSFAAAGGGTGSDLLVEHDFSLSAPVDDLEVRMEVRADDSLVLHAVQIIAMGRTPGVSVAPVNPVLWRPPVASRSDRPQAGPCA